MNVLSAPVPKSVRTLTPGRFLHSPHAGKHSHQRWQTIFKPSKNSVALGWEMVPLGNPYTPRQLS